MLAAVGWRVKVKNCPLPFEDIGVDAKLQVVEEVNEFFFENCKHSDKEGHEERKKAYSRMFSKVT